MKNIFIETYGCQMNEYDTELVRSILQKENYVFVKNELDADIVLLNTCAIRENAHRKVYGRVHEIKHLRGERPVMIGILGCMATNLRTELLDNKSLDVDFIAGPDSYKRLPQLIEEAQFDNRKVFDVTLSEFETYEDIYPARKEGVNAWIAVMRGCNNFCTFCVVPYTRGRERSRSVENVVEEVRKLAAEGFKQVTLLGQNVNSYKHETHDFADLMQAVSEVKGIERIRYTSPHPKDFPDKFLELMARNPKICNHIHLPLQSGNNRILDLMNRIYTREEFLAIVDKARTLIPNVTLTTDVIVGFSSETEEEFEDTMRVMERVKFDSAFSFKYSERKNTIASKKYSDDISEETKKQRIMRLVELQKQIALERNQRQIGTIETLLIEEATGENKDQCTVGRTEGNKLVIMAQSDHRPGEFLQALITGATPNVLKGEIIFSAVSVNAH